MNAAETRAVRIVRATQLGRSTGAGDRDAHRADFETPTYGLQEATGGRARAVAGNLPLKGFPRLAEAAAEAMKTMETGWHYHNVDVQLAFITGGEIDIAYSDGEWRRCRGGEILLIPGYVPHNAGRISPSYGLVELTFPGEFGSIPCPPHPRSGPVDGSVLTDDQVQATAIDGVATYVLPPALTRTTDLRLITSGAGIVETPRGGLTLTLLFSGRCEVDAAGEHSLLGPFDMLIDDDEGDRATLSNRSPDFRAYQVQRWKRSGPT